MIVYLIAGTNGSGKSTLLMDFIRVFALEDVEYICKGFHYACMFTPEQRKSTVAKSFYMYKRDRLLREKCPMIMEHALESRDIFDFLMRCKEEKYRIVSVFVKTRSPLINIKRIGRRVEEGGHAVKKRIVFLRYFQALRNLPRLKRISDEFYLYDNSYHPRLVEAKIDGMWFGG